MKKINILPVIILVVLINVFCNKNIAQNNCATAIIIPSLPYTDSISTCGAGADYGAGQACLDANFTGEDVVYKFTPTKNMCVNFNVSHGGYVWDGVHCVAPYTYPGACPTGCSPPFSGSPCTCNVCGSNQQPAEGMAFTVLDGCPNAGGSCIDGKSYSNIALPGLTGYMGLWVEQLTAYQTYYIIIDEKSISKCHSYSFSVNETMCVDTTAACGNNLDFEYKNFTNWTGGTGTCCPINITIPGIVSHGINSPNNEGTICLPGSGGGTIGTGDITAQHSIITGPETDPYTGNVVKLVSPNSSNFSARVGNANVCAYASQLCHDFVVTSQNEGLTYMYAVVFEDPAHTSAEQPRFQVEVKDQGGSILPNGSYYFVSGPGIPGFQTYLGYYNNTTTVHFKDWTYVGMDLRPYLGQTLQICYTTGDCSPTGHFGYAYIDVTCRPVVPEGFALCGESMPIQLCAPPGYAGWTWSTGDTTECITNPAAAPGTPYTITIMSINGYQSVVEDTLKLMQVDVMNDTYINCNNNVALTTSVNTYADYIWSSEPPGFQSYSQSPVVSPAETTTYTVMVSAKYSSCQIQKKVVVNVINGFSADILKTDASCFGCSDGSATVFVSGGTQPYTYLWSTTPAQTTETISGLSEGAYSVTITDASACQTVKYVGIDVFVGVSDNTGKNEFLAYPNPTNDKLYVEFENKNNSLIKLQITNLIGKIIYSETSGSGTNRIIDLSKQPNGMYLLKLQTDDKIYYRKILLEK
ncbi:MAG: T9SS type A sorting domain-containing protein [Bacteroidales bacterium]|nr:T9SS type A sorting domain-containing protein [Bacteroidales bacterium]